LHHPLKVSSRSPNSRFAEAATESLRLASEWMASEDEDAGDRAALQYAEAISYGILGIVEKLDHIHMELARHRA
jgi:hypothetical protein